MRAVWVNPIMSELDDRFEQDDDVHTLVRYRNVHSKLEWFLNPRIQMKLEFDGVSPQTLEVLAAIIARIDRKMDTGDEAEALDEMASMIRHYPGLVERVVTYVRMLRKTARGADLATDADWEAWIATL